MHHERELIMTIAVSIGLAFALGLGATRLKLPPLVGYLVAGVLVGPFTPGFVADGGLAGQLSEIGVILLMFGVGIHFSPKDLLSVKGIAVPGAIVQSAVATALGAVVARMLGWSWASGIVFGLCLSVASTVVLLRALEDRGMVGGENGRIAVGWLIVEDLMTVLVLVLLPLTVSSATHADGESARSLPVAVAWTIGKVALFVALMFVVGRRVVPWLLARVARTGSRELFTLAVLAVALGIGVGAAAVFDVSFALGAFFAGMVVNGSALSREAAKDALPFQDAFSVLFFVAVGMLFDPLVLVQRPLEVLAVVFIVMVGKSLAAFAIVRLMGRPTSTAFTISASLAQIGEFSFILVGLAVSLGLLTKDAQSLVVAGALISITLNPLMFVLAARASRPARARDEDPDGALAVLPAHVDPETLVGHAVLVGYGRVGSVVADTLARERVPYVLIDRNRDVVEALRADGRVAILGDAARAETLSRARTERARVVIVATPDAYESRAILERAKAVNPALDVVVRTHSDAERDYLERAGAGMALVGERELALGLAHYALTSTGCSEDRADDIIQALRRKRERTARRDNAELRAQTVI
jgi:CPA2 family monovalent cation:H+ antiporter-2